jgi:hypothetical protein
MGIEVSEPELSTLAQINKALVQGQAAIEELALLKPILALAISKLPKQQLKLSLTDQTRLSDLDLQVKKEEKSGAILLRAVKA